MPKKKTTAITRRQPSQKVAVTFQPSYESEPTTIYSNFASISHTNNEFCLDFCLIAPPYKLDMDNKAVVTPVIARIIIPPNMVEALREALEVELEKYTKDEPNTLMIPKREKSG